MSRDSLLEKAEFHGGAYPRVEHEPKPPYFSVRVLGWCARRELATLM